MCVRAASWQNIIYSIRIGAVYCILCLSCEIHCSMYANARTEYHSRSGLATCKSIVKINGARNKCIQNVSSFVAEGLCTSLRLTSLIEFCATFAAERELSQAC